MFFLPAILCKGEWESVVSGNNYVAFKEQGIVAFIIAYIKTQDFLYTDRKQIYYLPTQINKYCIQGTVFSEVIRGRTWQWPPWTCNGWMNYHSAKRKIICQTPTMLTALQEELGHR